MAVDGSGVEGEVGGGSCLEMRGARCVNCETGWLWLYANVQTVGFGVLCNDCRGKMS